MTSRVAEVTVTIPTLLPSSSFFNSLSSTTLGKGMILCGLAAIFVLTTWIVTSPVVVSQSTSLLLIQMLFRHGARAPTTPYPTDPNPPEVWPQGLEQLTQLGKKQQYALGAFLRDFYNGFVTSNPNEILVNSTDFDRCLQSALSNLASFYAPTEQWVVKDGLDWQPVVVHYRDKASDKYLAIAPDCPKLKKEVIKQFSSSDFQAEFEKHRDMIKALKLYGGLDVTGWFDVFLFHDAISTEKYHGLKVPEWIEPYWAELTAFTDLTFFMLTNTTVLQRLRSGPFLEKLLENMDNKIAGKDDHLKVHINSAHDLNIAAVLESLGLYESHRRPPFAACLLVELHQTQDGQAVRLLYLNSTTMEDISTIHPVLLKLQGCGEFCPLKHFRQLVQPIIPDDWNKECQIKE